MAIHGARVIQTEEIANGKAQRWKDMLEMFEKHQGTKRMGKRESELFNGPCYKIIQCLFMDGTIKDIK